MLQVSESADLGRRDEYGWMEVGRDKVGKERWKWQQQGSTSLSLVSMIMADFGDERIDMRSQGDQVS